MTMTIPDDELKRLRAAAIARLHATRDDPARRRHPDWDKNPTYVVVSSLPGEVRLMVIRDPSSPTPRMIVFDENTITEARIYSGISLLIIDERAVPTIDEARTLSQYADGEYDIEVGGVTTRRRLFREESGEQVVKDVRGSESRKILREVAKASLVQIAPGLFGRKYQPVK